MFHQFAVRIVSTNGIKLVISDIYSQQLHVEEDISYFLVTIANPVQNSFAEMLRLVLMTIGLYAFQLYGAFAITVIFEDFEIPNANEAYFADVESFITEDQKIFVNLTILKTFPEHCQSRLVMYGLSQGEFVLNSGIDMRSDLCDMVSDTFIMGDLLTAFKFSNDDCPPSPGVYGSEDYQMDTSNFPDLFPRNKYLAIFTIDRGDENIVTTNVYVEVQ